MVFNTGLNGVGIAFNYTNGSSTGFDVDSRNGSFTGNIDGSMEYYIVKTGNISGGVLIIGLPDFIITVPESTAAALMAEISTPLVPSLYPRAVSFRQT
ncbi:hypothetical protein GGER_44310 [Serratia rubidaea]